MAHGATRGRLGGLVGEHVVDDDRVGGRGHPERLPEPRRLELGEGHRVGCTRHVRRAVVGEIGGRGDLGRGPQAVSTDHPEGRLTRGVDGEPGERGQEALARAVRQGDGQHPWPDIGGHGDTRPGGVERQARVPVDGDLVDAHARMVPGGDDAPRAVLAARGAEDASRTRVGTGARSADHSHWCGRDRGTSRHWRGAERTRGRWGCPSCSEAHAVSSPAPRSTRSCRRRRPGC